MLALCLVENEGKYGFYLSENIWQIKGNKIEKLRIFNKKIFADKSINMKIGTYGIFNIKSNSKSISSATFRPELQIIEICKLEKVNNLKDLYYLLMDGIDEESGFENLFAQKIFFTSENLLDESKMYLGFLCDVSDIEYSDSKFFLKKTINRLLKYHLTKSNIITVKNDFYRDILISKEIYDLGKENTSDFYSKEEIKDNEDSIINEKNIDVEENNQLEAIAKNQDVFEKSQKELGDIILPDSEDKDIFEKNQKEFGDVILSNNIDKDIIEKVVNDRFTSLQKNIDSKIDKEDLKKIVENQLVSIYSEKDVIVKQFEEKLFSIKTDIENKIDKKDFDVVNFKLNNLEYDIKLAVNENLNIFSKKISEKIEKLEKDNNENFALLSNSHDELEKKLNNFEFNSKKQEKQENLVSHLISLENFQNSCFFTNQIVNDYDEIIEILGNNLDNIDFSESSALACLLYILYKNNIPLFLLGPNGENIADVFSITMFGKPAVRLECLGDYSLSVKKEIARLNDRVVIIKNPFNWIQHIPDILQSFEDKYFFVVYPFIEDIVIEPQSLYNYMVPFFTEYFFESISQNFSPKFIVCKKNNDFEDYKFENNYSSLYDRYLKKIKSKNIFRKSFSFIISNFEQINDSSNRKDIEYMLLFSYAFLTGKSALFFNLIENKDEISPDLKDYFDCFKIEEE